MNVFSLEQGVGPKSLESTQVDTVRTACFALFAKFGKEVVLLSLNYWALTNAHGTYTSMEMYYGKWIWLFSGLEKFVNWTKTFVESMKKYSFSVPTYWMFYVVEWGESSVVAYIWWRYHTLLCRCLHASYWTLTKFLKSSQDMNV